MPQDNKPYSTPTTSNQPDASKDLQGLGGWLILLGIIIAIAPFRLIAFMYKYYQDVFANEAWGILTNPENTNYVAFFKSMTIFECVINIFMLVIWFIVIYLFFTKKKLFKKFFISILVFTIIVLIVDSILANLVLSVEFDRDTIKEIFKACFSAVLWGGYTLKSKRVANTFIN